MGCLFTNYDKRDAFPFFIVRMPNKCSNIPSTTFYGAIMSELLRIARSTLLFIDFLPRAKQFFKRMISQGASAENINRQLKKAFNRHPEAFKSFEMSIQRILYLFIEDTKLLVGLLLTQVRIVPPKWHFYILYVVSVMSVFVMDNVSKLYHLGKWRLITSAGEPE